MLYLIAYLLIEPVKRIASALLYPLAYALRKYACKPFVIWPEYLFEPRLVPAWLFLDDSILMEFKKEYADNPKYYPAVIWNTNSDFLRAYWWAAIRNSMVNWNNYSAYLTGDFVKAIRRYSIGRSFYEVREFANCTRPYCEVWVFNRRNQVGWIKRGRFEIDVMKIIP